MRNDEISSSHHSLKLIFIHHIDNINDVD